MPTKIYMICNAYESGFGHGLNKDGLEGDYYADTEHNEAYHIGYRAGAERACESNGVAAEYKKYEFCKDIGCPKYSIAQEKCMAYEDCVMSARDFHAWLRLHGWEILKKEAGNG